MRIEKKIEAVGREVVVRELTVAEIRAWLAGLSVEKDGPVDLVEVALLDGFALSDILLMTDLSKDELSAATPSEIEALFAEARAVNAHFFGLISRLEKISGQASSSS